MAIDARYQDNVVLKQDAFQNLLTNIKNYPIIDIDQISENDTDVLHGDHIWEHYTNGEPCIKITYGDDRTTKGNIMFAEQYKNEIAAKQNTLKHLQTILDELTKRKSRWEAVYEENHAIYQEKDNQVQRFIANFEEIKSNKLSFLMAGWNLLYINLPINIDDPYEVVPADAANINQYNPNVIYYTHSKEYMFKRYEFKDGAEFIDVYTGIKPSNSLYNAMRNDWAEKVANQEIYTKKSGPISPDALLLQQELGPQLFSYENILIKKNPYILIQRGTAYDSNATYYVHNSSNGEFSTYINNHVSSSDPSYTQKIEDWNQKVLAKVIYIKTTEDDPQRVFNLTYTSLGSSKADVLSILQQAKNRVDGQGNSIWKTNPDEQEVFDNFIEFIMAYNKLVFLDTIGIAGYSANDIEDLKRENPDLVTMVQRLTRDDGSSDFDWEAAEEQWNSNLLSYYNTFYQRIAGIVDTIKNVINNNLIYIRNQIRDANASIVEYTELVNIAQRDLDALWERINNEAVYEYVPVPEGATYNVAREYFTYNSNTEQYVPYIYTAASWGNSTTKYVKNDRTIYGYKYVRVGDNVKFTETYTTSISPYHPLTQEELEIIGEDRFDALTQESGTFRVTINNNHTYEIPIKGFGNAISNKTIAISAAKKDLNADTEDANIELNSYKIICQNPYDPDPDNYNKVILMPKKNTLGQVGSVFSPWAYVLTEKLGYDYYQIKPAKDEYDPQIKYYKIENSEYVEVNNAAELWGTTDLYVDPWVKTGYIANVQIRDRITANNASKNLSIYGREVWVYDNARTGKVNRLLGLDSGEATSRIFLYSINVYNNNNFTGYERGLYAATNFNDSGSMNGIRIIQITTDNKININTTNLNASGDILLKDTNNLASEHHIMIYKTPSTQSNSNATNITGAIYLYASADNRGLAIGKLNNNGDLQRTKIILSADNYNSVYINTDLTMAGTTLYINNTNDAREDKDNNPGLIIGDKNGQHIELDDNEIISKPGVNGRSSLYLNGSTAYYEEVNGEYRARFYSEKVKGAVFNDYAEYRTTINLEAGRVVIDQDDGSLKCSDNRLLPGAQIISDTFGFSIGEMEEAKTPLAIAGRVLAYTYQDRHNYHAGMAVCSAPNGTVDIMTREEIRDYPDCIVGIVSEIPEYEEWGTDKVKVNGRIWIKVK